MRLCGRAAGLFFQGGLSASVAALRAWSLAVELEPRGHLRRVRTPSRLFLNLVFGLMEKSYKHFIFNGIKIFYYLYYVCPLYSRKLLIS